jgi:hypothetical protein
MAYLFIRMKNDYTYTIKRNWQSIVGSFLLFSYDLIHQAPTDSPLVIGTSLDLIHIEVYMTLSPRNVLNGFIILYSQ